MAEGARNIASPIQLEAPIGGEEAAFPVLLTLPVRWVATFRAIQLCTLAVHLAKLSSAENSFGHPATCLGSRGVIPRHFLQESGLTALNGSRQEWKSPTRVLLSISSTPPSGRPSGDSFLFGISVARRQEQGSITHSLARNCGKKKVCNRTKRTIVMCLQLV